MQVDYTVTPSQNWFRLTSYYARTKTLKVSRLTGEDQKNERSLKEDKYCEGNQKHSTFTMVKSKTQILYGFIGLLGFTNDATKKMKKQKNKKESLGRKRLNQHNDATSLSTRETSAKVPRHYCLKITSLYLHLILARLSYTIARRKSCTATMASI